LPGTNALAYNENS